MFIEATREAIDGVLAKHTKVGDLVDNEWLHLFQIDSAAKTIAARRNGNWITTNTEPVPRTTPFPSPSPNTSGIIKMS